MITALSLNTGGLGRFGNQCFTLASAIGIAIKSGQLYGFPKWINRDNALFGGAEDNMADYFVNPLPECLPEAAYHDIGYFWEYRDLNLPTGNWNMNAHLQSVKWFRHCLPLIRYYFTMKDEPEQNDLVAIHVRMGDYINDPNAYHPVCEREYYMEAMRLFPGSNFILFSDDWHAAYKMLNRVVSTEARDMNYMDSFKLMKKCKGFITANSSFSHFAALLGDHPEKKIVMPRKWFGAAADGLNFDSLYPEEAIVI